MDRRGVPAAAILTRPFMATARAIARIRGIPDYPFVVIDHPIGSADKAGLRARAQQAVTQIEAIILGNVDRG